MHKFNHIRQVVAMCPYGRTRCPLLSNNIEPSIYGNDAPYVRLLWPLVIFRHAHLDGQTAERFELSTVLWAFHTIQPSSFTVGRDYCVVMQIFMMEIDGSIIMLNCWDRMDYV